MSSADLQKLVSLSNYWGSKPLHIQGPGGNFSFKSGEEMWIKSSGVLLKEVSPSHGITKTSTKPALAFEFSQDLGIPSAKQEMEYVDLITDMMCEGEKLRPSMESAFHAILKEKWVLHTHSAAMTFLGSYGEEKCLSELQTFSGIDFVFIEQCLPGYDLARRISLKLRGGHYAQEVLCIILQNHGVIWASNDGEALEESMLKLETELESRLGLDKYELPKCSGKELDFSAWPNFHFSEEATFPDYALFFGFLNKNKVEEAKLILNDSVRPEKLQDAYEICFLQALLSTLMMEENSEVLAMSEELQAKVADMEIEKLRMQQIGQV